MEPGALFGGRYRLVRLLGQGGMGVVWHAKNEAIDRDVALKLMAPGLASNEDALRRFFNEARICGGIRHPGIVDVLDLGRTPDGEPFLVMELLEGVSLERLIDRRGSLAPADICSIVRDAAATVALAHDKGVIHRDLKPGNLFLHRSADGKVVVKVLDFGISKVIGGDSSFSTTRTGMMLGTPSYMSPEQAGGRLAADHRADVYALGAILYEGLSGKLPYEAPTAQALLIDIATAAPIPLTQRMPHVAPALAQLVADCIEKDRDRRIQSAREIARRLGVVMTDLGHAPALDAMDLGASTRRPPPVAEPPRPAVGSALARPALPVDFLGATTPAATPQGGSTLASPGVPAARPGEDDAKTLALYPTSSSQPVQIVTANTGREGTVAPFSSSSMRAPTARRWRTAVLLVVPAAGLLVAAWRFGRGADETFVTPAVAPSAPADATSAHVETAPTPLDPSTAPPVASSAAAPLASASVAPSAPTARPGVAGPRPPVKPKPAPSSHSPDGMWGYE